MLETRNLEITRGDRRLLDSVELALKPGTLLRVTGANGSGKTSLLRALCGLLAPSGGDILWNGESIRALREEFCRNLVYVGHNNALKDELTASENLRVLCALSGIATGETERRNALAAFGLQGREHLPAKSLSQGQRRRTALARLALAGALPLWILDEPFAALDTAAVDHVRDVVGRHLSAGGMVVMTTHQEAAVAAPVTQQLDLDRRSR